MKSFIVYFLLISTVQTLYAQPKLNPEAWKQIYSKDGIVVYSQKTPHSSMMAFKANGVIKGETGQIMEILRNVEGSNTWMPNLINKITLKETSDYEAITLSVNNLPWPLRNREMIQHNKLFLNEERQFLEVDVRSIPFDTPHSNKEHIQAFMHIGKTMVRPAGKGLTEVELEVLVEPRGFIPTWLVNFVQQDMPYDFLKALEKKAISSNIKVRPNFLKILQELEDLRSSKVTAHQSQLD